MAAPNVSQSEQAKTGRESTRRLTTRGTHYSQLPSQSASGFYNCLNRHKCSVCDWSGCVKSRHTAVVTMVWMCDTNREFREGNLLLESKGPARVICSGGTSSA